MRLRRLEEVIALLLIVDPEIYHRVTQDGSRKGSLVNYYLNSKLQQKLYNFI